MVEYRIRRFLQKKALNAPIYISKMMTRSCRLTRSYLGIVERKRSCVRTSGKWNLHGNLESTRTAPEHKPKSNWTVCLQLSTCCRHSDPQVWSSPSKLRRSSKIDFVAVWFQDPLTATDFKIQSSFLQAHQNFQNCVSLGNGQLATGKASGKSKIEFIAARAEVTKTTTTCGDEGKLSSKISKICLRRLKEHFCFF